MKEDNFAMCICCASLFSTAKWTRSLPYQKKHLQWRWSEGSRKLWCVHPQWAAEITLDGLPWVCDFKWHKRTWSVGCVVEAVKPCVEIDLCSGCVCRIQMVQTFYEVLTPVKCTTGWRMHASSVALIWIDRRRYKKKAAQGRKLEALSTHTTPPACEFQKDTKISRTQPKQCRFPKHMGFFLAF